MCSVFSCSIIFSLPLILTLVVASISHFFTAAIKFPCFSSKKWSSLFLISRSSSLSVKIWLLRSKRERALGKWLRNQIFLPMVLRCARERAPLSFFFCQIVIDRDNHGGTNGN